MAGIVNKVKALGFAKDEVVVIGSGLIDALGYRDSNDIDLAVSDELFERLKAEGTFEYKYKIDGYVLMRDADSLEVWNQWTPQRPFAALKETAVEIDGVWFVNPEIIIELKKKRNLEKDQKDIAYLEDYLNHAR